MPCIEVLKEKIVPFGKTLFMRGGGTVGGPFKKIQCFWGISKKMSQVRKFPPPSPRDLINERSLIASGVGGEVLGFSGVNFCLGIRLQQVIFVTRKVFGDFFKMKNA